MTGGRPRVLVLYNAPTLPLEHPDAVSESDVVEVAHEVASALEGSGFDAEEFAAGPPLAGLIEVLERSEIDVVFNLIEGFAGRSTAATHITGLIELCGRPYTGSTPEALARCVSKGRAKALLRGFGLPTAAFEVVPPGRPIEARGWSWPSIVKPDEEDGSLGIDQGSVVLDAVEAARRASWIHESYGGPALLETYLPGPEFNVGVLGLPDPVPLPVAEVAYEPSARTWPILTYQAKWSPGSLEDLASPIRCPARIDPALAERLGRLAVLAFEATGCRDYARIDLRLDDRGEPMILEVNPNPDIGPGAGWARALRASGRQYSATIGSLARQALDRGGCLHCS